MGDHTTGANIDINPRAASRLTCYPLLIPVFGKGMEKSATGGAISRLPMDTTVAQNAQSLNCVLELMWAGMQGYCSIDNGAAPPASATGVHALDEAVSNKRGKMVRGLREVLRRVAPRRLEWITDVLFTGDDETFQQLREGRWVSGRFHGNIRIDQPTDRHGEGQQHAHVYGRNSKQQLVAVHFDGTASHGTRGRLHPRDADALRAQGFEIPQNNIVEWTVVEDPPGLLLE